MHAKTFLDVDYTSELEKKQIGRVDMKNKKVTIKKYGLIDWLIYQYDNKLVVRFIIDFIIPVIVSIITTLIVIRCK